jgi:hypothetical protein
VNRYTLGFGALLLLCVFAVIGFRLDTQAEKLRAKNAWVGERQLLQITVNASRHYWYGETLYSDITIYYPDDNLDTTVYRYRFDGDQQAIVAIAKDVNAVPKNRAEIAYSISTALPVHR